MSLLLLVFLLLSDLAGATTRTGNHKGGALHFLEAPFFQNSPQCNPVEKNKEVMYCRENVINIVMTLDEAYLRGSMAAILSIVHHSDCPENLFFHLVYSKTRKKKSRHSDLRTTISSSFPYLHFEMYPFDEDIVKGRISMSLRQALDRPLNYARSYLTRLLPDCIRRVIYLDSDVIVVDNIGKLWGTQFADAKSVIAAPEYCEADMTRYFTRTFWSDPELASTFAGRRSKACYFNTGVMVVDLDRWRANDYTREIEDWMEVQKRTRIYDLGSLPPFLLVFAGEVTAVEPRWNQHGLGGDNYEGHCRGLHPGEASLLHWSGRGKPWVRLDEGRPCPVDALWAPYDMLRKPYHSIDH